MPKPRALTAGAPVQPSGRADRSVVQSSRTRLLTSAD